MDIIITLVHQPLKQVHNVTTVPHPPPHRPLSLRYIKMNAPQLARPHTHIHSPLHVHPDVMLVADISYLAHVLHVTCDWCASVGDHHHGYTSLAHIP